MFKRLAAVSALCLIIASSPLTLQGYRIAFASKSLLPEERSNISPFDSRTAMSLIEQVAEKSGSISFNATKTVILWYPSGTSACISKIIHKAPNLTRTEYLPSSASTCGLRTVISDGKSTWHYEPDLQVVFHMTETSSLLDEGDAGTNHEEFNLTQDVSLIKANYDITLIGTENLAGRQAYIIGLEPRHPGNPSRKIWVDSEYPFVLRTEKYAPCGTMSSVSFYNWIEFFPTLSDDLFELDIPSHVAKVELPVSGDLMPLDKLEKKAEFAIPVPGFVPPGYKIEGGMLSPYRAFPAAHIRLTDGLNTISYFVTPRIIDGNNRGENHVADVSDLLGTKFLRWSDQGYDFALVGEVDKSLLIEIAQSVNPPRMTRGLSQQSLSQYLTKFFYQMFWIDR